jgi:beta-phosphoglucomutase-like phosphatase (HAD superfamily)
VRTPVTPARDRHYDHVAFDLDGTLVDSRADLAAATNHVLRSFALPEIPPRSVYRLVGEGARRLVERALGPAHTALIDQGVERFPATMRTTSSTTRGSIQGSPRRSSRSSVRTSSFPCSPTNRPA